MNYKRNSTVLRTVGAAAAVLLVAGSVFAQDAPRRGAPNDALRGPSVNDRAMPRGERFGESQMQGRQNAGVNNFRLYVAVIKDLADHDNPRLKLTDEQVATLTRIENAHQGEMRAYIQQSRQQNEALRERVQRAREQAGDDREAVEQIMQRARARAEEIRAGAPKSDAAEARMWEVLTQPQRRFVTAEMERRSDEQFAQRQQQLRERQAQDTRPERGVRPNPENDLRPDARPGQRPGAGPGGGPDARPARPGAERGAQQMPEQSMRRWAQMFERIQRLTPQQQDRLFNMMNDTLNRIESSSAEQQPQRGAPQGEQPRRPGAERPGAERPAGETPQRERRQQRPGTGA